MIKGLKEESRRGEVEMKFVTSGFSDEIDANIESQFSHLNALGIGYFEPRGVNGKNIADLSGAEVEGLKEAMLAHNIKVSSIGSPIGKIKITDGFAPHLEKLARVIEIAKALDARYIRVFSFFIPEGEKPEAYRDEVLFRMKEMTRLAEKEGAVLLHENEKEIYGDLAPRCLEILEAVQSPCLRAVFDPANFVQCGQSVYPEAFSMLAPYIEYVHIKDAQADGVVVPAGFGAGGLFEVLSALAAENYEGFLSLEPHLGDFAGFSDLENGAPLKKFAEFEKTGAGRFTLAHNALADILKEVEKLG
jgi:sugar phosphate isomerase/epimerase